MVIYKKINKRLNLDIIRINQQINSCKQLIRVINQKIGGKVYKLHVNKVRSELFFNVRKHSNIVHSSFNTNELIKFLTELKKHYSN